MTTQVGSSPTAKQHIYQTCPAIDVVYGGSAGGGKTYGSLNDLLRECIKVPGEQTLFLRRELDQLAQTIEKSKTLLRPYPDLATWNQNDKTWTFAPRQNPWCKRRFRYQSTLLFDSIPTESKKDSHQGPEYGRIAFDEATHFPTTILSFLQSRNRSPVPGPGADGHNIPRMRYATNPGNVGHLYFLNEFVAPHYQDVEAVAYWDELHLAWRKFPPGTTVTHVPDTELPDYDPTLGKEQNQILYYWRRTDTDDPTLYPYVVWLPPLTDADLRANQQRAFEGLPPEPRRSRCFVQAFLSDNPTYHLGGAYAQTLRSNPDRNLVLAQLYGRWDVFEGQFFQFDPAIHVVDPFVPPDHWYKWGSIDYGSGRTGFFAALWHTRNPESGQIFTYREYYERGDRYQVRDLLTLAQHEYIHLYAADPSMWQGASRPGAVSAAEFFRNQGLNLQPAINDRVSGWNICKTLMQKDIYNNPGWVCTRNCHNMIRTLPLLVYKDTNEYDLNGDGEDHIADSWRYGMQMKPAHHQARSEPLKLQSYVYANR